MLNDFMGLIIENNLFIKKNRRIFGERGTVACTRRITINFVSLFVGLSM